MKSWNLGNVCQRPPKTRTEGAQLMHDIDPARHRVDLA